MATLAVLPLASAWVSSAGLTAAAGGLGAALAGGAILTGVGVLGAVIDQAFIFPALFRQRAQEGPRLEDFQVNRIGEGSPIYLVLGTAPVSPALIWASPVMESSKTSGSRKGPRTTTYSYSQHIALGLGYGRRELLKLWANGKLLFDTTVDPVMVDQRLEEVEVYEGSSTQTVNALMEGIEGSGNVPAFRGICYAVLHNLQLADFGNSIPQFKALLRSEDGLSLDFAIETLFEHAGWDLDFVDASSLSALTLRGLSTQSPSQVAQVLEPLILAYNLIVQDQDGVLTIRPRVSADTVTVTEDDLGAAENPEAKYELIDPPNRSLPSEVSVRFVDVDTNYEVGQKTERSPLATAPNIVTVDLPVVLTPQEGRALAQRLLWAATPENRRLTFTLPPSATRVQEGDLVVAPLAGVDRKVRVGELNRGWNYGVQVTGFEESEYALSSSGVVYPGGVAATVSPARAVKAVVMDLPALTPEHAGVAGVYVAVGRANPSGTWGASRVYWATATGSYIEEQSIVVGTESILGEATSVLADVDGLTASSPYQSVAARDDVNTVDVEITSGVLEEHENDAVIAGINWALLGNEIIGFLEAELIGTRTYRLSKLYRGLVDKIEGIPTHAIGDQFVLLDPASLVWLPLPISNRNTTLKFKAVGPSGVLAISTEFTGLWQAEALRHYYPHALEAEEGTSELIVNWVRRSRTPTPALDYSSGPIDDVGLQWVVTIEQWDGSDWVHVMSEISSLTTNTITYTVSLTELVGQGYDAGEDIRVKVYIIDALTISGRPCTFVLSGGVS